MTTASMQEMWDAGVQFGHQTKYWNPKMAQYIYGVMGKVHVINLDKTVMLFNEALKFIDQTIRNKGTILFVGTRSNAGEIIANEAIRAGMPYVNHRWLGGMLTNFETVRKSIKKLETKTALLEKAEELGLSKKETLDLTREIAKLRSAIGGIVDMERVPTALFIIDTGCHDIAIQEARKLGITVVGVVDTNNDPSAVDYVIPGNDDSTKAVALYAKLVADQIIEAKDSVVDELVASVKLEMVDEQQQAKAKTGRRIKKVIDADLAVEETIEVAIITDDAEQAKLAAQ